MQPRTTLTINEIINEITNEIINEIINEITNDKNEWQKEHSKHHMSYHLQLAHVKNETIMSKMKPQCQNSSKLCQKSSTNPQRWIFTSSRFMLSITCCILTSALHQWKWSVRVAPLMNSMKTNSVTKIFHEWQILTKWFCEQNFHEWQI